MTALSTSANSRKLVDLSVLMPFFNHGANLAENVKTTLADLNSLLQLSYELIVVDDGSTDATYEEACRIASANPRVSVLRMDSNSGKGAALRMGFAASRGGLICFLDGDLQISARHIPRFIEYMRLESADVVVASKRHPLSVVDYPRPRRILSRSYQLLISTLFGVPLTDTQAGLKLFRREVLERIFQKALVKRYAFDVELLANVHRLGYRIAEAPVEITGQKTYQSHVDLAAVRRMFHDTMGIFYRMYIRGYYDAVPNDHPSGREVVVIGRRSESVLATARFLTAKEVTAHPVPFTDADSMEATLQEFDIHDPAITFVCLDDLGRKPGEEDIRRLNPYLDILAYALGRSQDYKCFAFAGALYPGTTMKTIVPYLEGHSQKRIGKDFDVIVLPSFDEVGQIFPQSQQPLPLPIGSTSLNAVSALSRVMREFVPVMIRMDPSTAEAAHYVQRLIRSEATPVSSQILDICNSDDVDLERILRFTGVSRNGDLALIG